MPMTGSAAAALLGGTCAAVYTAICGLVLVGSRLNRTSMGFVVALCATIAWSLAGGFASGTPLGGIVGSLDLLRTSVWYGFVLYLHHQSFGHRAKLSRIFAAIGLAAVFLASFGVQLGEGIDTVEDVSLLTGGIGARLLLAVCQLLLLENLYLNTPSEARWNINLICVALGSLSIYDVILCADAVLFRRISPALADGRVAAVILVAPLLAAAAARNRKWKIDIHISRGAAFHSVTLLASGIFLLALATAGEVFRHVAPRWGGVAEVSLIFAGAVTVVVLLTSGSARSQINTLLVMHFFSQRYDYRREWRRCIDTLSDAETYPALHARVIRAIAQVVDSPGGILFLREDSGFHWSGSWNMPAAMAPIPLDHPLPALFKDDGAVQPDRWTWEQVADQTSSDGLARAWLAVPLRQGSALIGFVLVARSRARLTVDTEVSALLRTVGHEVATYVAEQRAARILVETRHLRDYGKHFAFVAHDIKNVSSQLSLLLSNAELHMQNPAFQHDMLTTVRSSVQKIGTLLQRLQPTPTRAARAIVAPREQIDIILERYRCICNVTISLESEGRWGEVVMDTGAFEAVINHLLDNAIEAADPSQPIRLRVRNEARRMRLDIIDCGRGMTAEFIHDRLFRPFDTSKPEGSGIGAFQARELLRDVGGDLLVLSTPGAGTTMRVLLPLVDSFTDDPSVSDHLRDTG